MTTIEHHSADLRFFNGYTVYWFDVSDHDYLLDGRYGVCEYADGSCTAVDSDERPCDQRDARHVLRLCVVTDAMRKAVS